MWRLILIGSSVSLSGSLVQGTSKMGAGDGLALVFISAVLVVALALYAVRPKGWGLNWPASCVPMAPRGEQESEQKDRMVA